MSPDAGAAETKVVIVGGSSRGIGAACVRELRARGCNVAAVGRTQAPEESERFLATAGDLRDPQTSRALVNRCRSAWGRVDAVVHCAGDILPGAPIAELSWSRWLETFDVCLKTAVELVRASIDAVRERAGSYVFVSSVAASHPYPDIADYCAAKAALSSFTRSLALELAPSKARANAVSPAVVDTELFRRSPYTEEQAAAWHKLGRIGRPDEVAKLVCFLTSDEAAWITGRDYVIDGGMTL